jgi:hypothetical protein
MPNFRQQTHCKKAIYKGTKSSFLTKDEQRRLRTAQLIRGIVFLKNTEERGNSFVEFLLKKSHCKKDY